jgi:phage-related minor tail protein
MAEEVRFILSADDSKAAAALKRTEDGVKRVGSATAYTKQQMQQLSFQMTDIVSGLATGQSPFMILMQQGGQLRDTFGGLGGAVRAVASVFTLGRVATLGMAGAAGLFAKAAFDGWQESNRLRDAIALTGNAAGVTEGSFNSLTERIAATSTATIGAAREMTQSLVATGRIGAPALESAARAATLLQRATGAATDDIVRDFSRATQGVAKWAQETNERYHFLDLATFKLIQKQEKLGNTQEALRIAFEAFSKPLAKQQENLGYLERAWNAVGKAASSAWDSMLSAGRAQTVEERIADVQRRLANGDALKGSGINTPLNGGAYRSQLQLELAGLMRERRAQMGAADLAAAVAAQQQKEIANAAKNVAPGRAPDLSNSYNLFERSRRAAVDAQFAPFDERFPFPNVAEIIGNTSAADRFRQNEAAGYGDTDGFLQRQAEETVERNRWMVEQMTPEWKKLAEHWDNTTTAMGFASKNFTDGFVDAGRDAFEEFMRTGRLSADSFKNLFIQTVTELIYDRLIAKQMGTLGEMLWNYVAQGMTGGGWGGGSGDPGMGPPAELAGTRARGGSVDAGRTYLVGERGPELLRMGGQSGWVVPNHAMGGGGGSVVIHQHINVGQGVTAGEVFSAMRVAKDAAVAEIQQKIDRGNRMFRG